MLISLSLLTRTAFLPLFLNFNLSINLSNWNIIMKGGWFILQLRFRNFLNLQIFIRWLLRSNYIRFQFLEWTYTFLIVYHIDFTLNNIHIISVLASRQPFMFDFILVIVWILRRFDLVLKFSERFSYSKLGIRLGLQLLS